MKKQLVDECKIRIEKNRLKPIDHFVKIILVFKSELQLSGEGELEKMRNPKMIIDDLTREEIEAIMQEFEVFFNGKNKGRFSTKSKFMRILSNFGSI